jgi:hypothetical protein
MAYVPKTPQSMVAATLRQALLRLDRAQASVMLRRVADQLRRKWPNLAALIDNSETEVLSYRPISISANNTVASYAASTRSNGSMTRSSAAPMSSGSFQRGGDHPADRRSVARAETTTGSCSTATCRSKRWPN